MYRLVYLAARLHIPALLGLVGDQSPEEVRYQWLTPALRKLFWHPDAAALNQKIPPAKRDWFSEMMWLIARAEPDNPDGLVQAVIPSIISASGAIRSSVCSRWRIPARFPTVNSRALADSTPQNHQGTFSADGNVITGDWIYPGGGGYSSVSTRVK